MEKTCDDCEYCEETDDGKLQCSGWGPQLVVLPAMSALGQAGVQVSSMYPVVEKDWKGCRVFKQKRRIEDA